MFWWKDKAETPVQAVEDVETVPLTIEQVVREIVEAGYVVQYEHVVPQTKKKGVGPKRALEEAVNQSVSALRYADKTKLEKVYRKFINEIETEALKKKLVAEVYDTQVEVARARAMVKGLRAGLTGSDAYLKLAESVDLSDVLAIERWIERSEAYKAYLEQEKRQTRVRVMGEDRHPDFHLLMNARGELSQRAGS